MASKTWSAWLDEVLLLVPGCLIPVAENAIRNAAIEFCRRTNAWRYDADPIVVVAGVADYDLDVPSGSGAALIRSAEFTTSGGALAMLDPKSPDQLDEIMPGWKTEQSAVVYYTSPSPDVITLAGLPEEAGTLKLVLALVPTRASTGIDQSIHEQHLDAITHGAAARLMAMPKKPWSDPNMAAYHAGEFANVITGTKVSAARGNTRAPIRTRGYYK